MQELTSGERKRKLSELKSQQPGYIYRDQLMVTEFGLAMTALAVGLTAVADFSEDKLAQAGIFLGISLFLLVIARHLGHINQDREKISGRIVALNDELGFEEGHARHDGLRDSLSAPRTMVWFVWTVCAGSAVATGVLFFRVLTG